MEDQYGLADLRQYIDGGHSFFPPAVFPSAHRSLATDNHPYNYMFNFSSDNSTTIAPPAPGVTMAPANTGGGLSGFVAEAGGGGDGGAGRWPRQETLTLLEIRSKLDPKFKEANQKGPLWDEISRIMSEEYGYHRSGKKCREKFENLYKYYKKTKGGKAGRQDGKHYRFFRQLEALYGDQTNNNINNNFVVGSNLQYEYIPKYTNTNALANNNNNNNNNTNNNQESYSSLINISNSSDFDTLISSEDDSELNVSTFDANDPKRKKKAWKKVLKAKIKETIDSQMKKMMEKQEAWMEKMMKMIEENERERISREERRRKQDDERVEREQKMWAGEKAWIEARDAAVMDAFRKLIAGKEMSVVDSELITRDDKMCKENWDCVSDYLIKKRKDSSKIISGSTYDESSIGNDSCFRYFNGVDGYGRLMN